MKDDFKKTKFKTIMKNKKLIIPEEPTIDVIEDLE